MQGGIDLGKSDEATAQSGSVDELAGELIGCRCARSATSLQLPYSLSRLIPLQPCSLTCWLSIYRITIASPPSTWIPAPWPGRPLVSILLLRCFMFRVSARSIRDTWIRSLQDTSHHSPRSAPL